MEAQVAVSFELSHTIDAQLGFDDFQWYKTWGFPHNPQEGETGVLKVE